MIRSLSGTVLSVDGGVICLDVSGFGLEVYATGSLLGRAVVGEFLTCGAYLQVSDAGMSLFGFSDEIERMLFLEITQVKTMGGKLSIALLRHLDAESVVSAILAEDPARLAVPGIGAKRAERICFELRAKVEKKIAPLVGAHVPAIGGKGSIDGSVIMGLTGLGFSQSEAVHAVAACRAERSKEGKEGKEGGDGELGDASWTEEELMKSALGLLQRRR